MFPFLPTLTAVWTTKQINFEKETTDSLFVGLLPWGKGAKPALCG